MKEFAKYSSYALIVGGAPCKDTSKNQGEYLTKLKLVNSANFSIEFKTEYHTAIGNASHILCGHHAPPETKFSFSSYFSDGFNEDAVGLKTSSGQLYSQFSNNWARNFYALVRDDDQEPNLTTSGISGTYCMALGDCYLENYSIGAQVGGMVMSDYSYAGSNLAVHVLNGLPKSNPSLLATTGQTFDIQQEDLDRSQGERYSTDLSGNSSDCLVRASDAMINFSASGAPFITEGDLFSQSFKLDMPLKSIPIYGFGANAVKDRKIVKPNRGTFSVDGLVRVRNSGDFYSFVESKQSVDIGIGLFDPRFGSGDEKRGVQITLYGAKLENLSTDEKVGGFAGFSAQYSFDLETGCLFDSSQVTFIKQEDNHNIRTEDNNFFFVVE